MSPKTATPAAASSGSASSPAEKAYEVATAATTEASAALGPANDKLGAARKALADAQDEALRAITEKSADPAAAKERLQKARQAIKDREDDLDWALLELQSFEVADQQAHDAEQVARRAVIIERIQVASREYNDPASRENVLLGLLKDTLAELIPIIADREELHRRLTNELPYLSPQEKAQLAGTTLQTGRPVEYARPTLTVPGQPLITLDSDALTDALTAGIQAAGAAQAERERARRHG
jgi:hypothetical protein